MQVSALKLISMNRKYQYCISDLWNIPDYRAKMKAYSLPPTEEEFLNDMIAVFSKRYYKNTLDKKDLKLEKTIIKKMLKILGLDKSEWGSHGFPYEIIEEAYRKEREHLICKSREDSLEFLYDQLGLSKDHKPNLVRNIARNDELYEMLLKEANGTNQISKQAFYSICERVLLPQIQSNENAYISYRIMCLASSKQFNDPLVWIDKNELDIMELRFKVFRSKKG